MRKRINKSGSKNSKPAFKREETLKITPETTVILSIYEEGVISEKKSNAGTKAEIRKIKSSSFWNHRQYNKPPKNYYESKKFYNAPELTKVTTKVKINSDAVSYFVSDDGKPYRFKGNWKSLSKIKRLEENLKINANDNPFDYQIID